jgi:hypothetical protein
VLPISGIVKPGLITGDAKRPDTRHTPIEQFGALKRLPPEGIAGMISVMSPSLTLQAFVAKWRKAALKESAAAVEPFLDLCQLIGHPTSSADSELKKRKLTNLHNQRPTWLDIAHKRLDASVFAAYGWPADLSGDEILERLLALNLARAGSSLSVSEVEHH